MDFHQEYPYFPTETRENFLVRPCGRFITFPGRGAAKGLRTSADAVFSFSAIPNGREGRSGEEFAGILGVDKILLSRKIAEDPNLYANSHAAFSRLLSKIEESFVV
jgi:hypothetical protein